MMRRGAILVVMATLISVPVAYAAAPVASLAERHSAARKALEEQRAEENQTAAERDRLASEARTVQQQLIANAAKVQELEAAQADTQRELDILQAEERTLTQAFSVDREKLANLLAVLQRLDADQPPALAMRPADSLAAARGTMILGSMLPPIHAEATALAARLRRLSASRAAVEAKNTEARVQAERLATARANLSQVLAVRTQQLGTADVRLAALRDVTEEAARETNDLKTLIDRIAGLRTQGDPDTAMVVVTPQSTRVTALRRGSLVPPVVGTSSPGDPAGPGRTPGISGPLGLWFEASGGAQVVAPTDSEVIFAGPYQKFGHVLLLEIAGGYHLLLAGLDRIDARIGDAVLAGEPIGVVLAVNLSGGGAVRLYLELRRDGERIDPAPWMSAALRKAR